jgi:hypothetical protein
MEYPIAFLPTLIPIILLGNKTQTRRTIKPQPSNAWICGNGSMGWNDMEGNPQKNLLSPWGRHGDTLWVQEQWDEKFFPERHFAYKANDLDGKSLMSGMYEWKEAKTMPRHVSRILLTLEDIDVEPLQSITESDAIEEGFSSKCSFAEFWDYIYGEGSFDSNPWVWALSFKLKS